MDIIEQINNCMEERLIEDFSYWQPLIKKIGKCQKVESIRINLSGATYHDFAIPKCDFLLCSPRSMIHLCMRDDYVESSFEDAAENGIFGTVGAGVDIITISFLDDVEPDILIFCWS